MYKKNKKIPSACAAALWTKETDSRQNNAEA